jgi:hypothetical protein
MSEKGWGWLQLLNVLCVCLPVVAFASPCTVFGPVFCGRRSEAKRVIEMPPLALTSQMVQCYLFAIYAFSMGNMVTLLIPNVTGFALGLMWSTLYPLRMTNENYRAWKRQCIGALICMAACTLFSFGRNNPYVASSLAAGVGIIMCTYPLSSMKRTLETSNPALLGSVYMNVAMLACCSSWVVHASPLVQFDGFVLISNGAGVLVQGSALLLRFYLLMAKNARHPMSNNAHHSCTSSLEEGILESYHDVYRNVGNGEDVVALKGQFCDLVPISVESSASHSMDQTPLL